jgi:tetratricopeptide (TPR) repeat protein
MAQKGVSPRQYLQKYNEELAGRKKLLEHVPRLSSYNVSLMTTWEMSVAAVQDENPLAIKFLMLSSFLHNTDLHFELFRHSPVPNGDWLYEIARSEDFFLDQIEILSNFSFLQPNDGTDPVSYSIHPVVQDWGRDRLQKMEWIDNLRRCIAIVGAAVPSQGSTEAWETRRRLISHADRCAELLDKYPDSEFEPIALLDQFGRLYFDYHRLDDAERMYKQALRAYRLGLGPNDSMTLGTMNGLAMVHQSQGRLAEAKKLLQAALDGYQETGAFDNIFGVCINFACIYTDEGDLHSAELICRKAMEYLGVSTNVQQKRLTSVLFNLSGIFRQKGLLIEAENLLELALQRYRNVLGPHDIKVYDCMNNLGNIYEKHGRLLDAEDAFQTALSGYSEILGPDHVMTLMVSNSLHCLSAPMTKETIDERVLSCRRTLKKQEDARGLRSLAALGCMVNLGMSLSANGEFEEASTILQQAYQNLNENFGPNHYHTISALSGLGCLYGKQKKLVEARSFLQRALTRSEEVHGREDQRTLHILCNLADLCNDEGRSEEAEAIFLKVIGLYEKTFGVDNVSTLGVVQRLGRFYLNNCRMAEAECNLAKALHGFQKVLGTNHPHTLNVAEELLHLHHIQQLQAPTKVTYEAFCGKPESGGCLFPFAFVEEAPSFLCDKSQTQNSGYDEILRKFLRSTISRHDREILLSRPWTCEICGERARELFHSAIPFLVPGEQSSADFKPTIYDLVIPICRFAGECDRKAEEMAHASSKEILPTGIFNTESRTCNTCFLKKNIKLCMGCRTIG